jgi:hypothetical protein
MSWKKPDSYAQSRQSSHWLPSFWRGSQRQELRADTRSSFLMGAWKGGLVATAPGQLSFAKALRR